MLVRCILAALGMGFLALPALAEEVAPVLEVHDRQFVPQELVLPAGVKLKLVVRNQDGMPLEFESYDMSREVVIAGHSENAIYVGPLQPGRYRFFNDFNHAMQGTIVVRPADGKGQ